MNCSVSQLIHLGRCLCHIDEHILIRHLKPESTIVIIYQWHLVPLQAANCCRNSRQQIGEQDDLTWVANEKITLFFKTVRKCVGN